MYFCEMPLCIRINMLRRCDFRWPDWHRICRVALCCPPRLRVLRAYQYSGVGGPSGCARNAPWVENRHYCDWGIHEDEQSFGSCCGGGHAAWAAVESGKSRRSGHWRRMLRRSRRARRRTRSDNGPQGQSRRIPPDLRSGEQGVADVRRRRRQRCFHRRQRSVRQPGRVQRRRPSSSRAGPRASTSNSTSRTPHRTRSARAMTRAIGLNEIKIRQNYVYIESEQFGRISLGQQSSSSDGITEIVLGNSLTDSSDIFGCFRVRLSNGDDSGLHGQRFRRQSRWTARGRHPLRYAFDLWLHRFRRLGRQ